MKVENPFENWTYVSKSSEILENFKIEMGNYNSGEKILEARGYCEDRRASFAKEDLFIYNKKILLVIEKEDEEGVASLVIPGFLRRNKKTMGKNKIFPVPSIERGIILRYLNRDNIDCEREKMDGIFWNTEVGVGTFEVSNRSPIQMAK